RRAGAAGGVAGAAGGGAGAAGGGAGAAGGGAGAVGGATGAARGGGFGPGAAPETITEIREFTHENGQTTSLTFYALIVPVSATVSTLQMQLYLITGIMLALSVFIAVIMANRVSKPIEDITNSAQILAKGDYNTRFSGKGFHEIVALSDTLNTAATELGKVEGLRRELLANVSHDLRTPLTLIYSYAEMMSDFPNEITPEHLKIIMDETRRLTTLVNDVLDISKLESDMEQLRITRFNLTKSVAETTKRVGELLVGEAFELVFSKVEKLEMDEIYVDADETKINRAFYNLLINGVNYSGGNRIVTVSQTVTDDRVRISVTDMGEGISEDDIPFIWDRYYKCGQRHTRAVTGTGLGLSIVKKIMDLHGGTYGVKSKIGAGSTFWFELKKNSA
ncbi:MAG: HAMP domain-containing histidine kinase, partial [Oscillospiraceae bacterium]|nr:HAMP domain-containing histidine kinase [Oscillospiraceae bacterium]